MEKNEIQTSFVRKSKKTNKESSENKEFQAKNSISQQSNMPFRA